MTPDRKKKVATKKAVSSKETPVKKAAVNAKPTPARKVTKKTSTSPGETTAKKSTRKSTSTSRPQASSINITSEERWKLIAIAAYHRAEKRGFAPGGELQDWAEAEQEVDDLLMRSSSDLT